MDSFEQQSVIIKGLLQSKQLEKHTVAIGADQPLSNCELYEQICLENTKKLYKSAGKYNYQQQYKAIIEAEMVSNTERGTGNIPMSLAPHLRFPHFC